MTDVQKILRLENEIRSLSIKVARQTISSLSAGGQGSSAYELALDQGYEGSEEEWLESLVGADGANGTDGLNGITGGNPTIVVETPTDSEKLPMFKTKVAITVSDLYCTLIGDTSPSVTWTIRFSSDLSSVGTEIVVGGTTTVSTTTGDEITVLTNPSIPALSHVWIETSALGGNVTILTATVIYTVD